MNDEDRASDLAARFGAVASASTVTLLEPTEDPDPSQVVVAFTDGVASVTFDLRHPDLLDEAFDPVAQAAWAHQVLHTVLSTTEVASLRVRPKPDYSGDLDHQWLADALADAGPLPVRVLSWGNPDAPCFVEIPDLSGLLAALPQLSSLSLCGEWETASLALPPSVEHLSLLTLRPSAVRALTELDLSRIARLELRLYDYENEGEPELRAEELEPLFSRALPALCALALTHGTCGPALVDALPGAAFFGQLETLALRRLQDGTSYLPEATADQLLTQAWAHLCIDVTWSFCDPRREPTDILVRLTEASGGRITG